MSWDSSEAYISLRGGGETVAMLSNYYFVADDFETRFFRYDEASFREKQFEGEVSLGGIHRVCDLPDCVKEILPSSFSGMTMELDFLCEEVGDDVEVTECLKGTPEVSAQEFFESIGQANDLEGNITYKYAVYDSQGLYNGATIKIVTEDRIKISGEIDPRKYEVVSARVDIDAKEIDCTKNELISFIHMNLPGTILESLEIIFKVRLKGALISDLAVALDQS